MAHVDAEHGARAVAHEFGGAQDRAVAAEHDRELDVVERHVVAQHRDARESGRAAASSSRSSGGEHRASARGAQRRDHALRGVDGLVAVGVRDDQDVALRASAHRAPCQSVHGAQPFCRIASAPRPGARCAMYSRIAVRAGDRGGDDAERAETQVPRRPQHAGHRVGAGRGIRHDPPLTAGATDLELRLDRAARCRRPAQPRRRRPAARGSSEMNDRSPVTTCGAAPIAARLREDSRASCSAR